MSRKKTRRSRRQPTTTIDLHWGDSPLMESDPPRSPDPDAANSAALRWRQLFEHEVAAREVARQRIDSDGEGQALRIWWETVANLLKEYEVQTTKGLTLEPSPVEIVGKIAGLARYLATGQIPELVRRVAMEGRRTPGPMESREMGLAVAYRKACSAHGITHNGLTIKIVDPTPIKTLAGWYGVKSRTVHRWVATLAPAFLGINDINEMVLTKLTKDAGASYALRGRSHDAITKRGNLRKIVEV